MKIIQVPQRFYPYVGGIETHVFEISKRMAKKHDVHIFTTDPSGKLPKEECIEGMKIKRFKSFAPNEAFFFSPALYSAIKKEDADILHIHSNQSLTSLMAFMGRSEDKIKKVVFTPHYNPFGTTRIRNFLRKIYDIFQKRIFLESDRTICVSKYEMGLLKKIKVPKRKMVQIPNGINIESFRKVKKVKKEHEFQILSVCRLEKYKRVQWVIKALSSVIKRFPHKDIHLVVVGKGPYKNNLLSLCKDLDLEDNVTFKEDLPYQELLQEYSKCDVFALPSSFEIFGIVVLEALAFNKPVIVSDLGAPHELFGKYGFVVSSVAGIEESLAKLINGDRRFKAKFDVKEYTWDSIAERILKLYNEVLEK